MIRAYKFLLRPTVRQAAALAEMLADHWSLYNGALKERRDAYRHVSKASIRYGMQSAQLTEIRAFDPEHQGRWSPLTRGGAGGSCRSRAKGAVAVVTVPPDG